MRQCIYCTETKPGHDFNTEHVMPQQLGHFHTNNLTLTAVCRKCNKRFGDGIERLLGRDSYEGLMRLVCGIKSSDGVSEFVGRRLEFRMPKGSAWEGARLCLGASPDRARVVMDLPAQIGIQAPLEPRFRYFLEPEFAGATDEELGILRGSKFKLLAPDEQAYLRLITLIRRRVPAFRLARGTDAPTAGGQRRADGRDNRDTRQRAGSSHREDRVQLSRACRRRGLCSCRAL